MYFDKNMSRCIFALRSVPIDFTHQKRFKNSTKVRMTHCNISFPVNAVEIA